MSSTKVAGRARKGAIPFSMGMVLVTLGVVYGDIGTSPMYTLRAIMTGNGGLQTMSEDVVLGALSLIIWTITLITTVKYVLVAMQADNHNEGGIFALYSLVKRCGAWLLFPAMIGGAALLADGILTPAVTVTTAIEGLRTIEPIYALMGDNQAIVIVITVMIISILFLVQRAGTSTIGKAFGPVMTTWFLFLGIAGAVNIADGVGLEVFRAFNPVRGITFLFSDINVAGLMVLGNVFLCTTGAEALYSDMGHVGKANIYASWPFVKTMLILNYLGQGSWILANAHNPEFIQTPDVNPFFQMVPENLRAMAVILSTLAAIIASQALITGSFSLVSEATRLNLMPHLQVRYPSETKGQLYIPIVNTIMWIGCVVVVLLFQTSSHMEAAYGLAITVTMLMTTVLLTTYISRVLKGKALAVPFALFFLALESTFFFSSLTKFLHGGYFTVCLAAAIFFVMYVWRRGTAIEHTQSVYLDVKSYIDQLSKLRDDERYPIMADNLVFLTNDSSLDKLDRDILYSILDKGPKRAHAYYFLNVQVTDEPNTHSFMVNDFGTDFIFKVQLRLGFRVNQRVNQYLYQIVSNLVEQRRLAAQPRDYSIYRKKSPVGTFRFCLIRKVVTPETEISVADSNILGIKYVIRRFCGSAARWYGLENSKIIYESVPLFANTKREHKLDYIETPGDTGSFHRPAISSHAHNAVAGRKPMRHEAAVTSTLQVTESEQASTPVRLPQDVVREEEVDVFSARLADKREATVEKVEKSVIGGDTASFAAITIEAEEEDADQEEPIAADAAHDSASKGPKE
ncbi:MULTISPECIES: KUP/HAK/KT family potassium transporter [Atopobiaceae]|uniref:Probable potassium transport system protein Kup n=1 Tax=Parafannyhessea umbonata TaxID=604330 RepID=A0A1H6HW45_9ACTN|nr:MULTISPECIES: KUP/HAK/KT family potassium transporter [Atopobiaceae]SEH38356.1 KUP system potassium uptake protein [Parafannyhessea umbonata]SJZ41395.1 KUP system potassium uptake protein [Olsenella sp. KH1P3]